MYGTQTESMSSSAPIPAVDRPETIYLAAAPGLDAGPMARILQAAGARLNQQETPGTGPVLEVVEGGLEIAAGRLNAAGAHLLLWHRTPAAVMADALQAGRSPTEALAEWTEQAEALLATCRRNRRCITLIEAGAALRNPAAMIDRLNQRLSLALSIPAGLDAENATGIDPVYALIAESAVRSDSRARHMAAELQATAIPIARETSPMTNVEAACQAYRQKETMPSEGQNELKAERDSLQKKNDELKEENDLLLLQLHQVQEELESYYLESRDIQQKYQKAETERKKLERERNTALQRAGILQKKIDAMRASRSWRLTKPLRAGNVFKRKRAK